LIKIINTIPQIITASFVLFRFNREFNEEIVLLDYYSYRAIITLNTNSIQTVDLI